VKLRSLLHRRQAARVPLLPVIEPEDGRPVRATDRSDLRRPDLADEERLERLLTPTELEMVLEHRV